MYEEFIDDKTIATCELPDHALMDAVIPESEVADEYRIDVIWYYLFQMKSSVGNNYSFRLLFNVARLVMVALHSSAGIERVYALVNKNKSEGSDKNRLDIEGTLSSILAVKLNQPEAFCQCYEFTPDAKLLSEAKKKQQENTITCIGHHHHHHHHHHHQNFRLVVVLYTFSSIDNHTIIVHCYNCFMFNMSGFSLIYLSLSSRLSVFFCNVLNVK